MKKEELSKSLERQRFSKKILKAFEKVDRSKFIPRRNKHLAYVNEPISIGYRQTISQPYTIAFMLTLLEVKNKQNILEVGSGSGYVLELISKLNPNGRITGIERVIDLVESSKEKLQDCENVEVAYGDGSKGFKKNAPYDRILTSAASYEIPKKLVEQLVIGGILVAPIGEPMDCSVVVLEKGEKENKIKKYPGFRFVPLIED